MAHSDGVGTAVAPAVVTLNTPFTPPKVKVALVCVAALAEAVRRTVTV